MKKVSGLFSCLTREPRDILTQERFIIIGFRDRNILGTVFKFSAEFPKWQKMAHCEKRQSTVG